MLLLVSGGEGRGRGGVLWPSAEVMFLPRAVFDETGHFVMYATLFGIKGRVR